MPSMLTFEFYPNHPSDHNAAATPELRILRQGPATTVDRGPNLFLRVHVLFRLCGDKTRQRLP